jgi:hypothetical protein
MLTSIGAVVIVIAVAEAAWGVVLEFRQSRETGPVAFVPTLPFGIQAAMLFTAALFLVRRSASKPVPPWACLLAGVLFAVIAIALITAAGRLGRRYPLPAPPPRGTTPDGPR